MGLIGRVHVIIAGRILFIVCFLVEVNDSRFLSAVHLLCFTTRFFTHVVVSPVTTDECPVRGIILLVPVRILVQPPYDGAHIA
jgi:hypothetical protein